MKTTRAHTGKGNSFVKTQLNAQAAIKWINEFENIRRKEPGLIK